MPKPPQNEPARIETMTWAQIYTALDARARDLRAMMLGYFAGTLASSAAFMNALPDELGGRIETVKLCYFGAISMALGVAGLLCALQTRRTVTRAEYVRKKFKNYADVPIVDRLFDIAEILRPSEYRIPDDVV